MSNLGIWSFMRFKKKCLHIVDKGHNLEDDYLDFRIRKELF